MASWHSAADAAAAEASVVAALVDVAETTGPVVKTAGIDSVVVGVIPLANGVTATRLALVNAGVGDAFGSSEFLSVPPAASGFRTLQ